MRANDPQHCVRIPYGECLHGDPHRETFLITAVDATAVVFLLFDTFPYLSHMLYLTVFITTFL